MTAHQQFQGMRDARGLPVALCTCDDCGAQETVRSDFDGRHRSNSSQTTRPVASQCVKKLLAKGWSYVRRRLRCPTCTKRRSIIAQQTKEDTMSKGMTMKDLSQLADLAGSAAPPPSPSEAPLPEPTGKQTRLMMMALEEVYDDVNKRYRGDSTDKTLAEELGDGIRPGWVAKLREQFFGPAGGNEEMERLRADIAAWMADGNRMAAAATKAAEDHAAAMKAFDASRERVKELAARLDVVCRNVGPKAGR